MPCHYCDQRARKISYLRSEIAAHDHSAAVLGSMTPAKRAIAEFLAFEPGQWTDFPQAIGADRVSRWAQRARRLAPFPLTCTWVQAIRCMRVMRPAE